MFLLDARSRISKFVTQGTRGSKKSCPNEPFLYLLEVNSFLALDSILRKQNVLFCAVPVQTNTYLFSFFVSWKYIKNKITFMIFDEIMLFFTTFFPCSAVLRKTFSDNLKVLRMDLNFWAFFSLIRILWNVGRIIQMTKAYTYLLTYL